MQGDKAPSTRPWYSPRPRVLGLTGLLLAVLIAALVQNISPVSQFLITYFAAQYGVDVLEYKDNNSNINTLDLSLLRVNYQGSQLTFTDLNITLTDTLALVRRGAFQREDLIGVHLKQLEISPSTNLITQLLTDSQQQAKTPFDLAQLQRWQQRLISLAESLAEPSIESNESAARAQLRTQAFSLPRLAIESVILHLPSVSSQASAPHHSLSLSDLSLSEKGELTARLSFDNLPLLALNAKVTPEHLTHAWQLDTQLSLADSVQGLSLLMNYLDARPQGLALAPTAWYQTLQRLMGPVDEIIKKGLVVQGVWRTKNTFNPLTLTLTSEQSLSQLSLSAPSLSQIVLAPKDPIAWIFSLEENALNLNIFPIDLSLILTAQDRLQLRERLALNETAFDETEAVLALELAFQGGDIHLPLNPDLNPKRLTAHFPSLVLEANSGGHRQVLTLSPLTLSHDIQLPSAHQPDLVRHLWLLSELDLGQFTLQKLSIVGEYDWHLQQDADLELGALTAAWADINTRSPANSQFSSQSSSQPSPQPKPPHRPTANKAHSLKFGGIRAHLAGAFSLTPDKTLGGQLGVISLGPQNQLAIEHITGDGPGYQWQVTDLLLANQSQGTLELMTGSMSDNAPANDAASRLTVPSLSLEASHIHFTNIKATEASQGLNAKLARLKLVINRPSPVLSLSQWLALLHLNGEASGVSTGAAPIPNWTNHLSWQLDKIDIKRPSLGKKRTKASELALLLVDELSLEQDIQFSKGLLSSQEMWRLDGLPLTSQHKLDIARLPDSLILAGQWQLATELTQLVNVSNKTQPLPKGSAISGHGELDASFIFQKLPLSPPWLELKLSSRLSDLNGSYQDYSFNGGSLTAQCQYDWQVTKSQMVCPELQLDVNQAQLGLTFDKLQLIGQVHLGKDDSKPAANWLQGITGLSDSDVKLMAKGDFLDGKFLIPDFSLRVHETSTGYILLQGVSLKALLAAQPQVGVSASGIFDGVLPASFTDGKLTISGGKLAARAPGGHIQVSGNPAMEELQRMQPHLSLVFTALEDLRYQQLAGRFDMTPLGDANIEVMVKGHSEGIERPIHLNYSHEENLLQLYRSLQLTEQLQSNIEQSIK